MLSPFWVVLFYFTLIMLGISQALALFHSVIQVILLSPLVEGAVAIFSKSTRSLDRWTDPPIL